MRARTRTPRRTVAALLGGAVIAAGGLIPTAAHAADDVSINLVTINDFHGRIENEGPNSAAAGIAALAGAVNQFRAQNPNTLFAAAGDLVGASTFTSFIQDDQPTIDGLNAAGLDVSSVGNHEFDQGWADLRDRIQPGAQWQYIAANLHDKATGEPIMPEYHTEVVDGVTVGFIGAVTNELPSLVSPAGIADVVVGDVTDNVNRVADQLSDGNADNGEADVIVLLVHEGAATTDIASATDPSSAFGRIVTNTNANVDAIVSGHTHLAYNHVINGRPVISSGQYGEKFSNMVITVNPDTKELTGMTNTLYSMKSNGALNYPEDQAILNDIVLPAKAIADEKGAVQVGTITADFNRAQQPGTDASGNPTLVENRGGESTLGNWVADVHLWAAQQDRPDTQIAFMNPGGLRADMKFTGSSETDPDGNVTYREAAAVQPFANTLTTLTLTGAQVKDVLEQQWQPAGSSRPFLKLGVSQGLFYTFNPDAAVGARITNITLNGAALDPAGSYQVVANSFLAAGGDNFTAFNSGTGKADTGKSDLQSVVDWFKANGSASPDMHQRAVGMAVTAPANPAGYMPGEQITLTLSGLDFTTTEPDAGSVTVTIGDAEVATAPVDSTLTTANDLTGRATVTAAVPAGVSGALKLTVTTGTGTTVSVPITVQAPPKPTIATIVFGIPNTLIAKTSTQVSVTAFVFAAKGTPTGTVTVYDRGKPVGTGTLTTDSHGVITIGLGTLKRGVHLLTVSYDGSTTHLGSKGPAMAVFVL